MFAGNLQSAEWANLFIKRQSPLTKSMASNIKRERAEASEKDVNDFFDNLAPELKDVEEKNVWNYDETNLFDDPGNKRVVIKRGAKYPERVMNTSKSAISLMFCGNAAGETLPPYTVYKAEAMWITWTEGGPPKARYSRTKSGWFDIVTFEDWFFTTVLLRLKKEEGKKVLIGDNLSSHISIEVVKACKENSIAFIAPPPNSTHLTQPLDISYFHPLKVAWR